MPRGCLKVKGKAKKRVDTQLRTSKEPSMEKLKRLTRVCLNETINPVKAKALIDGTVPKAFQIGIQL